MNRTDDLGKRAAWQVGAADAPLKKRVAGEKERTDGGFPQRWA